MVAGQVVDLAAEGKVPIAHLARTANDLEEIHRRKTGALFLASLRLGLLAAEGERLQGPYPATQGALDRFGRAFGLAFQIADDLLDLQGSSERTGKRVGKDAARGKLTFPGLLGVDESRRRVRELYAEAAEAADALGPPARPLADLARSLTEREVYSADRRTDPRTFMT